jgi:hypothetical protein
MPFPNHNSLTQSTPNSQHQPTKSLTQTHDFTIQTNYPNLQTCTKGSQPVFNQPQIQKKKKRKEKDERSKQIAKKSKAQPSIQVVPVHTRSSSSAIKLPVQLLNSHHDKPDSHQLIVALNPKSKGSHHQYDAAPALCRAAVALKKEPSHRVDSKLPVQFPCRDAAVPSSSSPRRNSLPSTPCKYASPRDHLAALPPRHGC